MPPADVRLLLSQMLVSGFRTFDALGVILHEHSITVLLTGDHLRQRSRLDVLPPLLCVFSLHDDHVAAISALVEQTSCRGAILEGRNDFDDVATERNCA